MKLIYTLFLSVFCLFCLRLFAVEEMAYTATGQTVYMLGWRNNPVTGTVEIYDTVSDNFVPYDNIDHANYDITTTSISDTGWYKITAPNKFINDGDVFMFDWRIQATGAPLQDDSSFSRYQVYYDQRLKSFIPPSGIIGQGVVPLVNAQLQGGTPVLDTRDSGPLLTGLKTVTLVKPTNVTFNDGVYAWNGSTTNNQLLRDSNEFDIEKPFKIAFRFTFGTGPFWFGLFEAPDNLDDISANLINIDENPSSKDALRAGWIIQTNDYMQRVSADTGPWKAVDTTYFPGISALNSGPGNYFYIEYTPGLLGVMQLKNQNGTIIDTIPRTALPISGTAIGFVANGVTFVSDVVVSGPGYRENYVPNEAQINAEVETGQIGLDLTAVLNDTNELQTDWASAGRLESMLNSTLKHNIEYWITTPNGDLSTIYNTTDPTP